MMPDKNLKDINPFKKWLFISLGSIFVGLAFLGLIIPLLPMTPFLLLSAYFYSRSSPRFNDWLHNNRFFGEHLRNYREGRGVRLRIKIGTLSLLWITIGLTTVFIIHNIVVRIVLILIAVGVTIHLILIPTYTGKE